MVGYLSVTDDGDLTEQGKRVVGRTFARLDSESANRPITIWGDSHAENWNPHTGALATSLGFPVVARGVSGQNSAEISARQGGVPPLVAVAGNAIPASGSVAVTTLMSDGANVSPLRHGAGGTRSVPAILAGVLGNLRTDDQGATYHFDRLESGYVVPVPPASPLLLGLAFKPTRPVFLAPRNDVGRSIAATLWRTPLEKIVSRYERMAQWGAASGDFLVLSMLPWADEDEDGAQARADVNAALRDAFPQQWLDWAAWLRTDSAFAAAGVTKTAQDITDIASGVTPTSFRYDLGHLNAAGYAAANAFLALAIQSREVT